MLSVATGKALGCHEYHPLPCPCSLELITMSKVTIHRASEHPALGIAMRWFTDPVSKDRRWLLYGGPGFGYEILNDSGDKADEYDYLSLDEIRREYEGRAGHPDHDPDPYWAVENEGSANPKWLVAKFLPEPQYCQDEECPGYDQDEGEAP